VIRLSNKQTIEEFCTAFAMSVESWGFWKEEYGSSDKIIIAGPSRIVGLIDLKKLGEIEWKSYGVRAKPTKKMSGNFVFEGGMYSIYFLKKIFQFLSEYFEVTRYNEAILFKLGEDIALGLAEKITNEDFYYNDEGVMFVESRWEETKGQWRTVTTEKEFIKWEDNMAKRKHKGKGLNTWYEEVYKWEYFFEEEDDESEMMLI